MNWNLSHRRSLAFGLLLAKRLVVEPEVVRRRARATSTHCAACTRTARRIATSTAGRKLLSGPVEAVLGVLTSLGEDSTDLRAHRRHSPGC